MMPGTFARLLCVVFVLISFGSSLSKEEANTPHLKRWDSTKFTRDVSPSLKINLKRRNINLLEGLLRQVSDPTSLCYGHYLDKKEVDDLFGPSDRSRDEVKAWLRQSGVDGNDIRVGQDSISVKVSADQADKLFGPTLFKDYDKFNKQLGTSDYDVPQDLVEHVDFIYLSQPLRDTTGRRVKKPATYPYESNRAYVDIESCQKYWTPACLQHVYNTKSYQANASSGSRIAYATFLHGTASHSDVAQFESIFSLPPSNLLIESIEGGVGLIDQVQDPTSPTTTPPNHINDLDVFTITSITNGALPMTQYSVGGLPPFLPTVDRPTSSDNTNEPYLTLFTHLLSKPNSELPQVITASYSEDEQTVPHWYAQRVCNAIGMLGLRGVSVIHTMGGAGPGTSCVSNDGTNTRQLTPQFPASCPWITGVGETNQTNPLMAWNITSGGFSWYFERPWYQEEAVKRYLRESITGETLRYYRDFINEGGRASPEISLQGFNTADPGIWTSNLLTSHFSGSTRGNSAFAAIIGLLNDARLRAGLPTMGFINPWLYKHASRTLTEITLGGSLGCMGRNIQFSEAIEGASVIPWIGWNATAGWDPAVGLGFPGDFERLRDVALDIDGGPEAFGGSEDWCPYKWWEIR